MVGSVVWWQKLTKHDSIAQDFINIILQNMIDDKIYLKNIFERIDRFTVLLRRFSAMNYCEYRYLFAIFFFNRETSDKFLATEVDLINFFHNKTINGPRGVISIPTGTYYTQTTAAAMDGH